MRRSAFTIVDIMIAVAILVIAILGTSVNRYNGVISARKADLQTTAVQTAQFLCEGWNGVRGTAAFRPDVAYGSKLNISEDAGPDAPSGFQTLGSYRIIIEDADYFATLSWQDVASDLRALSVIVNWDPTGRDTGDLASAVKSYRLITYVENPI
jgi:hypothetical protein